MSVIFNIRNSQLSTFSLLIGEIFQLHGEIGLCQIFQQSIFVLSCENAIIKTTDK